MLFPIMERARYSASAEELEVVQKHSSKEAHELTVEGVPGLFVIAEKGID